MYEPMYEEESGGGGFVLGLLCGAALGAAIGLMFAPKKGADFRQTIYESTGDLRRKAYDAYGQASEQVNSAVTKGRQAVERGREAFDNARQSATGGNGSVDFGGQGGGQSATDFSAPRPSSGV